MSSKTKQNKQMENPTTNVKAFYNMELQEKPLESELSSL